MNKAGSGAEDRPGFPSMRLLLLVLGSAVFVSVANSSMIAVALPIIQRDFGASEGQISWVVTGYLLVFGLGIPIYGRLSDFYGLRRIFTLGLVVLALGSLFCALAPSLALLVAGRRPYRRYPVPPWPGCSRLVNGAEPLVS